MKNLVIARLVGLALLTLAAIPASAARADFRVGLDFHGAYGAPSWGASGDHFHVYAKINNAWVLVTSQRQLNPNIGPAWVSYGIGPWDASQVQAIGVRVGLGATDALWIDRFSLQDGQGQVVHTWGANNLVGYCFSSKASDGNNAWCWNNRAYLWLEFNR